MLTLAFGQKLQKELNRNKGSYMPNFSPVMEWAMATIALLAVGGLIYQVIALVPAGCLVRCPETGTMTFVEIGLASPGDGTERKVTAQRCELWPVQYECDRRCLVGKKQAPWPKWGQAHISEAGVRDRISRVSPETWI
jgi:hypothetical protein